MKSLPFLSIAALSLLFAASASAGLVASWKASDLEATLSDGDPVDGWMGSDGTPTVAFATLRPTFRTGQTPTGQPVVRFNGSNILASTGGPFGGLSQFSIVVVLKVNAVGANDNTQWWGNSGLIDAEQPGVTPDWGTVIRPSGGLAIGSGSPDNTTENTAPGGASLVDGDYHIAAFTWGGGSQAVYIDASANVANDGGVGASARNNANFAIGGIATNQANRRFNGDIAEFRVFDNALSPTEVQAEIDDLENFYVLGSFPVISSFTSDTVNIFEGDTATLSWNVSAADEVDIGTGGEGSNDVGDNLALVDSLGVTPFVDTTYTLSATNPEGTRTRQVTILVDPGIPTAHDQNANVSENTPTAITLTATDPNDFPNSPPAFTVLAQPTKGDLTGTPPNLVYSPDSAYFGPDSFTFQVDDGNHLSNIATVSITVVPNPRPPTAIHLSTQNIPSGLASDAFVALISSDDPNAGDTHTYNLVAGALDNDSFTIVGSQLRSATAINDPAGTTFEIRLRSVDSTGLERIEDFTITVVEPPTDLVINEIHYNPVDNTVKSEFIELYNPAPVAADISNWRIDSAVTFVFPGGTSIPANGYLVIAQDPPTIMDVYGVTALGPYSGRLASEGEVVELYDFNSNLVDKVDYKAGFPWPVAASGDGPTIELINPELDNELGSSWRSSSTPKEVPPQNVTVLLTEGAACSAAVPTSNAQDLFWHADFFDPGFPEGNTGVGYENSPADYQNLINFDIGAGSAAGSRPTSVYVRIPFTIDDPDAFNRLILRMKYDDGFAAYLNGNRISQAEANAPATLTWQSAATGDHPDSQAVQFETFDISSRLGLLNPAPAVNILGVHILNTSANSSDMLCIPELEASFVPGGGGGNEGSPGAQNNQFALNTSPNIRRVDHTPEVPTDADPIVVTARVTDPNGVDSVSLEYQVVAPGAYIPAYLPLPIAGGNFVDPSAERQRNAAYDDPANWTTLAMLDDGTNGDVLAGDTIFTAVIPAQAHRTLVRYRITVADLLGASDRVPYPDDNSLNFAAYVYNGIPDYNGTPAATLETLPVFQLITRGEDYAECFAYSGADQISQGTQARFFYNWNGTMFHDGKVYDNIRYRLRGANGRYHVQGKRSMRLRFNKGYYLEGRDNDGKKWDRPQRTFTLGKGFDNRGTLTWALNEAITMHLSRVMGLPACNTEWLHWRVVDAAAEAPDRWRGDFHGIYFNTETYDVRFLESHNLDKGNLYKLINQTTNWAQQQRYQAADAPSDGSDHNTIEGTLSGNSSETFIRDHVNVDKWNIWHALVEAVRHYDFWPSANKNMVYYFEPEYTQGNQGRGKLWILPWDTDASWGPTWNSGLDAVYEAIFGNGGGVALRPEYFNVVRETRDLLWQPDQMNPLVDEFLAIIQPMEQADAARWKGAPADAGSYSGLGGAGISSMANLAQDMKNFAFVGGNWPGGGVGAGGRGAHLDSLQASTGEGGRIPDTPTITYTGAGGFPADGLVFDSTAFADPQGAGSFAAMEWRVARITDASAPAHDPTEKLKLEYIANWESGEQTTFTGSQAVPPTVVKSGHTYRARVRHKDNTGRWSHWSAPVEFTVTDPSPAVVQPYIDNLMISEFMYHPGDATPQEIAQGYSNSDFEFVELLNIGGSPLDLSPLAFSEGILFDFSALSNPILSSGARMVIVRDTDAFESRYGIIPLVVGEWKNVEIPGLNDDDKLSNNGEEIVLSYGLSTDVRRFTFSDVFPWPEAPDGDGFSLVLRCAANAPDHNDPANWRSSPATGGSPGTDDTLAIATWSTANGVTNLESDDDFDGLRALLEYLAGNDPNNPHSAARPVSGIASFTVEGSTDNYLTLTFTVALGRDDVIYRAELSDDLQSWTEAVLAGPPVNNGDGTETLVFRDTEVYAPGRRRFIRLFIEAK